MIHPYKLIIFFSTLIPYSKFSIFK